MCEMWNRRYAESKFIYGIEPNVFFKEHLNRLSPGKLLLPGDGEGRNAAYAAKIGWEVDAFDYSEQAVVNAKAFFAAQNVAVNCYQASILEHPSCKENYQAVALLFLHLETKDRPVAHRFLADSLQKGGTLLMEVFSKKQLGRTSGGPQNEDLLYDLPDFEKDFPDFDILQLEEVEIHLAEGALHQGDAMVIRFAGRKKI